MAHDMYKSRYYVKTDIEKLNFMIKERETHRLFTYHVFITKVFSPFIWEIFLYFYVEIYKIFLFMKRYFTTISRNY